MFLCLLLLRTGVDFRFHDDEEEEKDDKEEEEEEEEEKEDEVQDTNDNGKIYHLP